MLRVYKLSVCIIRMTFHTIAELCSAACVVSLNKSAVNYCFADCCPKQKGANTNVAKMQICRCHGF